MNDESLKQSINQTDVFDFHTHINAAHLVETDFWKIVEYFWFLREIRAAGYPQNASEMSEDGRMAAYFAAYTKTPGTAMRMALDFICRDLYGIEIKSVGDLHSLKEAIECTAELKGKDMLDRAKIKKVTINEYAGLGGGESSNLTNFVHRIEPRPLAEGIIKNKVYDPAMETIDQFFKDTVANRGTGVVVPVDRMSKRVADVKGMGDVQTLEDATIYAIRLICAKAEEHNLAVQILTGMDFGWLGNGDRCMRNDPERIHKLHALFEDYRCNFDILCACDINIPDIIQAVLLFPNVYAGGLWWMSFRPSIYRDLFEKRLEAIPSVKSGILASDAYCAQWAYGKTMLVKRLLGDFLCDKVEKGYLDENGALQVAQDWLYHAGSCCYGTAQR